MKSIVFALLLSISMALGLTACQEQQADPRIPDLEQQRDAALEESDDWRTFALLAGLGVMLFVGAGLGSSAKRKSEDQDG